MNEQTILIVILAGYGLVALLGYLARRVRRGLADDPPTDHASPDGHDDSPVIELPQVRNRRRLATTLTAGTTLLGIGVTVFWLIAATGVAGFLQIVAILIGIPVAVTVITIVVKRDVLVTTVGVLLGLGLLLAFGVATVNGLSYFTGLADEVRFHVTDTYVSDVGSSDSITGWYQLDGETHTVYTDFWLQAGAMPDEGTTIDLAIAPLWPHPFMPDAVAATAQLSLAGLLATPLVLFAVMARNAEGERKFRVDAGNSPSYAADKELDHLDGTSPDSTR